MDSREKFNNMSASDALLFVRCVLEVEGTPQDRRDAIALVVKLQARQPEIDKKDEQIKLLRGALADIAFSDDMSLSMAKKKAKRIYEETKGE